MVRIMLIVRLVLILVYAIIKIVVRIRVIWVTVHIDYSILTNLKLWNF